MKTSVRHLLAASVAAATCFVAPALASATNYAVAPMGAGGQWSGSHNYISYNRMSAANHGVSVAFTSDGLTVGFTQAMNFLQIGVGQYFATAQCRNLWATITTGYCAWYE